jgi:hypothetical protein
MIQIEKSRNRQRRKDAQLYWTVSCNVWTGEMWKQKELSMITDPSEEIALKTQAEALISNYLIAMHYSPENSFYILGIRGISETEYQAIQNDLKVNLNGYCEQ